MGRVLLVEVPPKLTSCIRDRLTDHRIENVAGEEAIAAELARPAGDLEALVVGPRVDSRVRVAEQACAVDPDIAVLMLCHHSNRKDVAQSLRFSAFAGPDVLPVVLSPEEPLADLVADAVIRTRQHRQHRSLLAAVQSATQTPLAASCGLVEEIRDSEERFRLVLESVTDPIVTIEADGRIRSANGATEAVFGYSASELVGQPVTILMPESLRTAHTAAFGRYLRTRERRVPWTGLRFSGRHKSGREIPLELSFGEFTSVEGQVFTGVFHDLTERRREEEGLRSDTARLKESNLSFRRVLHEEFAEKEMLERLAQIAVRVDSALSLEEVLERIFDAFATIVPYERMACALPEDDRETVRCVWVRSMLPPIQLPIGFTTRLEGSSLADILETGRPHIINDLADYLRAHPDSEDAQRVLAEGMRSSLTCPLIALGKPVGLLFFSSIRPNTYTEAHVEVFMRIAEQLSVIIERGRLWQQLVKTQRELEARSKFIADVFGRYTSESIVSRVLSSPKGLDIGGETRTVSVLFADLCGFSALCAMLDPQRVVRLLNIHLGVMTDVIIDHGGTIDELTGDGILVIFGAPIFAADHASRAVACAISMQRAMDVVRKKLSEEGLPAVEMGIAVHTGTVVAGNIGSEKRAKYGIVGAAVNLVTRIESFTAGGQILCTEDTLRETEDGVEIEKGPEVKAKGSKEPMQTFSLRWTAD